MKPVAVVGLFVLIACLHHSANGAVSIGQTDDCNKGVEGFENVCHRFLCDNESGHFAVHTCGSASILCGEWQQEDVHPEDLTKPYPECCAIPYCRDT